jgi:hypothetical protein
MAREIRYDEKSGNEIIEPGDPRRPSWVPTKYHWGNAPRLDAYRDGENGPWRETRWGQYLLPKHAPGKPGDHNGIGRGWQRVTTFIGLCENFGDGLTDYKIRHALKGLTERPDLIVQVAKLELPNKYTDTDEAARELKDLWRDIAEECHEASGGNEASENGTQVHAAIEFCARGGSLDEIPEKAGGQRWRVHVETFFELMEQSGVQIFAEFIERVVCPDEDGTVGTFDYLTLYQAPKSLTDKLGLPEETEPQWTVTDVKTGDVDFRNKMGRQLLRYAKADAIWNFDTDEYEWMPEGVRQSFGLVASVPWHEEAPVAELIPVPFEGIAGEEGLAACSTVKRSTAAKVRKLDPVGAAVAPKSITVPGRWADGKEIPVGAAPAGPRPLGRRPKKGAAAVPAPRSSGDGVPLDLGRALDSEVDPETRPRRATLARAEEEAVRQGRNDDPDDVDPLEGTDGPLEPGRASSVEVLAPIRVQLDAQGGKLGELAGPTERGCSVCRRKGHRAGSPKCLGDNDPETGANGVIGVGRRAAPALGTEAITPVEAGEPDPKDNCNCLGDDDWHPYEQGTCKPGTEVVKSHRNDNYGVDTLDTGRRVIVGPRAPVAGDEEEFCRCAGTKSWTAPAAEGDPWVHDVCGLPSRAGQLDGSGKPLAVSVNIGPAGTASFPGQVTPEEVAQIRADVGGQGNDAEDDAQDEEEDLFDDEAEPEEVDPFATWEKKFQSAATKADVIALGKQALAVLGEANEAGKLVLPPQIKECGRLALVRIS